jgi:hypothetical protein
MDYLIVIKVILTNDSKRFEFPEKRMAVSMTTNVLKVGAVQVFQVLARRAYYYD